jgi:hypothetical protein
VGRHSHAIQSLPRNACHLFRITLCLAQFKKEALKILKRAHTNALGFNPSNRLVTPESHLAKEARQEMWEVLKEWESEA